MFSCIRKDVFYQNSPSSVFKSVRQSPYSKNRYAQNHTGPSDNDLNSGSLWIPICIGEHCQDWMFENCTAASFSGWKNLFQKAWWFPYLVFNASNMSNIAFSQCRQQCRPFLMNCAKKFIEIRFLLFCQPKYFLNKMKPNSFP